MPSTRRIKLFGVLVFVAVITVLFYTSAARQTREVDSRTVSDFYGKTKKALEQKPIEGHGEAEVAGLGTSKEDEEVAKAMASRLKEAAQVAKDNANAKAPKPDPPSSVIGKGSAQEGAGSQERGVAGRKKYSVGDAQEPVKEESKEDHEVEVALNAILKKSPMIIFSKSYCPHSRRAKGILLEKYDITPSPFVVELDKHEYGSQLQAKLADLTGRRTVPNVLINGVSIGGGDEVAELDSKRKLIDKVMDLGSKKITQVKERPAPPATDEPDHGLKS